MAYPFALVLGFYETLFGSGNGMLFALVSFYTRGFDFVRALGYYFTIAFAWVLFASIFLFTKGYFDLSLFVPAIIGSVIGGYVGSKYARLKGNRFIKLVFVFVGTLSACGGSTTGGAEGTGGAAGTGGSAAAGATTSTCDVASATVAQLQLDATAVACVTTNCSANLALCLGANYAQGNYGTSDCSPYASCVASCNCVSSCSSNCVAPTACISCLTNKVLACAVTHCL